MADLLVRSERPSTELWFKGCSTRIGLERPEGDDTTLLSGACGGTCDG